MGETGEPLVMDPAEIAEAVSDRIFAFGEDLRIAWANRSFRGALDAGVDPVGLTLGEALACRHAETGRGCGTSDACGDCGWLRAASARLPVREDAAVECRVLSRSGAAFDFNVTIVAGAADAARPLRLCVLQDLFAQKRLRALERTFFHDVTNLAAGIRGLCELMGCASAGADPEQSRLLLGCSERLMDEIQRLRVLRLAESGDLKPDVAPFSAGELMRTVASRYADETAARRLEVVVSDGLGDTHVLSDRDVLHVVLCDLLQNAVEASTRGGRIELSCAAGENGGAVFRVASGAVLTDDVRAHVFERSFTTRGAGKGLGAYRAKLLSERFLGGRVSWRSQPSGGTVFSVALGGVSGAVSG